MKVTFITGNQNKANFLAKWLGFKLNHQKVELDELQSLDLRQIVEHKARQAYAILNQTVLVEDVGLRFKALGHLPGPFIKWFLQELSLQQLCDLLPAEADRRAIATVTYGLFDGTQLNFFEGRVEGVIARSPQGNNGFGFDPIFIPLGANQTYGEMTDEDIAIFGLRNTTIFPQLRAFFEST